MEPSLMANTELERLSATNSTGKDMKPRTTSMMEGRTQDAPWHDDCISATVWYECFEDVALDDDGPPVLDARTYPKNLPNLYSSLPTNRRKEVLGILSMFPEENLEVLERFVADLSDTNYEDLVGRFSGVALPRCQAYLEICASYFSPKLTDARYRCAVHPESHTVDEDHANIQGHQASPLEDRYSEGSMQGTLNLIRNVHDLPQEIYDQIWGLVLDASFRQGKIFPQQAPTCGDYHYLDGEHYKDPETAVFLVLDRNEYLKVREDCWSGNTWVIAPGSPLYSVDFLHTIPVSVYDLIRSIHISFALEDVPGASQLHSNLKQEVVYEAADGFVDKMKLIQRFKRESDIIEIELSKIWFKKFNAISGLNVKRLTLDLRCAKSPDGTFLGLEQVKYFPPFTYGMPRLKVLAPTRSLRWKIWKIFARKNSEWNY